MEALGVFKGKFKYLIKKAHKLISLWAELFYSDIFSTKFAIVSLWSNPKFL